MKAETKQLIATLPPPTPASSSSNINPTLASQSAHSVNEERAKMTEYLNKRKHDCLTKNLSSGARQDEDDREFKKRYIENQQEFIAYQREADKRFEDIMKTVIGGMTVQSQNFTNTMHQMIGLMAQQQSGQQSNFNSANQSQHHGAQFNMAQQQYDEQSDMRYHSQFQPHSGSFTPLDSSWMDPNTAQSSSYGDDGEEAKSHVLTSL